MRRPPAISFSIVGSTDVGASCQAWISWLRTCGRKQINSHILHPKTNNENYFPTKGNYVGLEGLRSDPLHIFLKLQGLVILKI